MQTHLHDVHHCFIGIAILGLVVNLVCALTVLTHDPLLTAEKVRQRLAVHEEIVHSTIEVHYCTALHQTS